MFQMSPGVLVTEKDYTDIVPAVSSSVGATVGVFPWGPVLTPLLIDSETTLISRFGLPNDSNFQYFYTAANFLAYTDSLYVTRAKTAGQRNAISMPSGGIVVNGTITGGSGYTSAPTFVFDPPQVVIPVTTPYKVVNTVTVGTAGTGYTVAPTVTFSAPPTGVTATGYAVLSSDGVGSIVVTNKGSGYTATAPTITISAPITGTTAVATCTVTDAVGGTTAAASATTSKVANTITISNGGTGYTIAPTVAFAAPSSGITATGFATVNESGVVTDITITNRGSGYTASPIAITFTAVSGGSAAAATCATTDAVIAVTVTNAGFGYTQPPTITVTGAGTGLVVPWSTTSFNTLVINNEADYEAQYSNGAASVGTWAAKYPGIKGNSIKVSIADSSNYSDWLYKDEFDGAPGTSTYATKHNSPNCKDEMHIIVLDKEGLWTGIKDGIMEKFAFVSKAGDAKKPDGTDNYYRNVINHRSKYIWWMDHPETVTSSNTIAWGTETIDITSANPTFKDLSVADATEFLTFGADDYAPDDGDITDAFALYNDAEEYDISLIPVGPSPVTVAKFVIENVAEIRKDCVAFISPLNLTTGEPIIGNTFENFSAIVDYRGSPDGTGNITGINNSTSYAVMDSGYKYQYDRYNDKYRWVPLNGDIAGLCARTDWTNDPWWSPGGYNRGQIKGVIKLAVNPRKAYRDLLYKNGINPVVTFPGQGTVLFGDKTMLAKPSAFDRINVRRLFIVLEKAIATASKYQLFEFNDDFTRRKFVSMVEPFLRDVQGRRGLTGFLVKCDTQNNTPEIIDRNEFVADIYIKPNRVINFLYLNFIATRTGVDFEEVGG